MNNTAAVILAGGRGKRMEILCDERPKPSLPFAGEHRVIDFALSNSVFSGLTSIAVLTDYRRELLGDYVNHWKSVNASRLDMRVLEPKKGSYNGTADAVYQNLEYFRKRKIDTVIILGGDHVYKMDYRRMLAFHHANNADVTVGITPVLMKQTRHFGTVRLDDDSRITEFIEKSPISRSNLASMGIYVFNFEFLAKRLTEDAADISSKHDFGYSLLPAIVRRDRAFGYLFTGYWQDIGTVESYYNANMELLRERPGFSMDGAFPVLKARLNGTSSCVNKNAEIRNCLVSPGCVIKGHVENSVLSPQVWVEEGAIVRNSVVMENTFVGHDSIIDGCILDEKVKIGEYSHIGPGYGTAPINRGVTVLGPGAVVPAHTSMGCVGEIVPYESVPEYIADTRVPGEHLAGHALEGITDKDKSAARR